jgi:predicted Rossmann fold nucleotide-binding protein DprA/Smf involved in DNA uptake
LTAVKADDESSIDEIIRASGLPSSAVNVALFSLEMKRLVKQLPGNRISKRANGLAFFGI